MKGVSKCHAFLLLLLSIMLLVVSLEEGGAAALAMPCRNVRDESRSSRPTRLNRYGVA
jgi:hypothetical protein